MVLLFRKVRVEDWGGRSGGCGWLHEISASLLPINHFPSSSNFSASNASSRTYQLPLLFLHFPV